MRINKQIFLSCLLVFALPAICATLDTTNVGAGVNPEVSKGSDGSPSSAAEAVSWDPVIQIVKRTDAHTAFPSPSYILEGVLRNAYPPSTLHMTGVIQNFVEPKPESLSSDFWELAKQSEENLLKFVHSLLETAATFFKSTLFTDIISSMGSIVSASTTFRDNIKSTLDDRNITIETFTEEIETIFMAIVNDLEKIPPPDKAPGHAERTEMVDRILDNTEQALVHLAARYGIKEEVVETYLLALKPQVQALTVAIGDINEQYPQLLPGLAFSVAILLIPEIWILRPLLSLFGFGPAGPIKGSAAAWMQRYFWGAAVEAGSWFSWLQAAGMGVLPKWSWLITKLPWLIGSVLAMFLPCLQH